MKKQSILTTICFFTFSAIIVSCGNGGQNTKTHSQSNEVEEKKIEKPKVEISGTYSGTDNVGMESTIILRSGGTLIIQASVGDGTPNYGKWTGTAENLSLYGKDAYGSEYLIGRAKVTDDGLQIIGGKFYSRR
jgi:hypothetical protein